MTIFTENEQKKIDEYLNMAQMSKRMTEEFLQICAYLHCIHADMPEATAEKMNKIQTKNALSQLRNTAVDTQWNVDSTQDESCGKLCGYPQKMVENVEKCLTDVERNFEKSEGSDSKKRIAYVEAQVLQNQLSQQIIAQADSVEIVNHYKDIFNLKGRNFSVDKSSGSFIIGENHDTLFYPGAPFCQSFGNEHFYYTSLVKNCIYNCDYCYLQGLYPCGLPVFFVNIEDYFKELSGLLKNQSVYLCISYDTDLLALEPRLHYVEKWIEFARHHDNLKIEVRTKSGNAKVFKDFGEGVDNVIFAWTLSPNEVVAFAEKGLPGLDNRIAALMAAKEAGFPVRICFDPMIYHVGWRDNYDRFFEYVFSKISPSEILDVSVGVFRISNNFLNRMRKVRPESPVVQFPYITENGACHYGELAHDMVSWAQNKLSTRWPELKNKIYCWDGKE